MLPQEIKKALTTAVSQFENEYPEWDEYTLLLKPDTNTVEVESDAGKLTVEAAKDLLRDFIGTLKANGLMIKSERPTSVTVEEYTYLVEDGLDDLADELEDKFGKQIANLKVTEKEGRPYVRFRYVGNLTSEEKRNIRESIVELASQYSAVDEDDVFNDVDFDDFDEVLEDIEENETDMVVEEPEEVKAEDMLGNVLAKDSSDERLSAVSEALRAFVEEEDSALRNEASNILDSNISVVEKIEALKELYGDMAYDEVLDGYLEDLDLSEADYARKFGLEYEDDMKAEDLIEDRYTVDEDEELDEDESNIDTIVSSAKPEIPEDFIANYLVENDIITLTIELSDEADEANENNDEVAIDLINEWANAIAEALPELKDEIEDTLNSDWYSGMYLGEDVEMPGTYDEITFYIYLSGKDEAE